MAFLFGILGLAIGAGLVYWLQNRKLESLQRRLDQKKSALSQAEALNRQQTAKMQQLQQSQILIQEREEAQAAQIQQLQASQQAEIEQIRQELAAEYQAKLAAKEQTEPLARAEIEQIRQDLAAEYQAKLAAREQAEPSPRTEWQPAQPSHLEATVDSERAEAAGQPTQLWEPSSAHAEQALLDVLLDEEEGGNDSAPVLPENGFSPESAAELVNPWEQTIASDTETFKMLELTEDEEEDEQNPLANPFLIENEIESERQDSEKDTIPLELDVSEIVRSERLKGSRAGKLSDSEAELDLAMFEDLPEQGESEIKLPGAALSEEGKSLPELLPELEESTDEELDLLSMLSLEGEEKETTETSVHGDEEPLPEWLATGTNFPEKDQTDSPFSAN
jgi:hypothetical protein